MKGYTWLGMPVAALLILVFSIAVSPAEMHALGGPSVDDQELVDTYAPVLYFHHDELFRPQSVDVLVRTARLQQVRRNWFDVCILPRVTMADLPDYPDDTYALDAWYGDEGSSDYKNYSAHRAYYRSELSVDAGGPPIVTYAHVVRDEHPHHITIQYWLFYYYNDWFNKHEGDWEMVQVVLSTTGEPQWLVLSQHHGGTRRPWNAVSIEEGTHPAVYVALGSHANYFRGDEFYPNGRTIGNAQVEIGDHTGSSGRTLPDVILIPDRERLDAEPAAWSGLEWLSFRGGWGELAPQSDFSGPCGPADKGDQWEMPYAWGMAQPPDADTWYHNRLRVEVIGTAADSTQVTLRSATIDTLESAETLGGLALLHTDPARGDTIIAAIEAPPGQSFGIIATWPDPETSQVLRYRIDDIRPGPSGLATLALRASDVPALTVAEVPSRQQLPSVETEAATWNAPDLVWAVGVLPARDVIKGIVLSLLAGVLPTLLYVGILYWADQYEKEPVRLLAAAFLWGAVPALLVAFAVRVFFRLPVDLLGPQAIEAVQAGLVTPLLEEALKGAVILFIAWRYRLEFDNVLDGIIYGAMVGLGFAMAGNTLGYLGAFLLYGFEGLGAEVFIEGFLYGLNHAMYSAIFGAGLGYARLAQKRWQRWAVPLMTFMLAVAAHALHNLARHSTMGWNPLTLAVTWAGGLVVIVAIVWSLRRQQRCLAAELVGEVPESLYHSLTVRGGCWRAQWRALLQDGPRGFSRMRHIHQQCAELAFKKMQHRQRPDEPGLGSEVYRLRTELRALVDSGS